MPQVIFQWHLLINDVVTYSGTACFNHCCCMVSDQP